MALITTTNFLAIADNVAKTLLDLETSYLTNPANNSPTVATISAGQTAFTSSLESRIAALDDITEESLLSGPGILAAQNVVGYLGFGTSTFYAFYPALMLALEQHTGGVNGYLSTNSIQVHSEFANAFNWAASQVVSLGLSVTPLTRISAANTFYGLAQTLGTIAVTGSATGNFSAGFSLNPALYAPSLLYFSNLKGATSTGTATAFTITYVQNSVTLALTYTLSGAMASGASVSLGVVGSQVTNITVNSGGASGDSFGVTIVPLRTVTY